MTSLGFTKSKEDSNLYFEVDNGKPVILLLYVDDHLLTSDENIIAEINKKIVVEFEMNWV